MALRTVAVGVQPLVPLLGLTRFESPLSDAWQTQHIALLTASERARLARIERPTRRAQFVVGHCMLRWLLAAAGLRAAPIEVDLGGALSLSADEGAHFCIAHSANSVAVIVAAEPTGVDLEAPRTLRDPVTAAALLNLPVNVADSASVMRAWVAAEARLKAGEQALAQGWRTTWNSCELAVAGSAKPPLTGVFDVMTGIYNAAELQWQAV